MTTPRLAYFCLDPGIAVFGTKGASVHVQEVVRAFRALGWEVAVYCTRRGEVVPGDLTDLRVVELGVGKGPTAERERRVTRAAGALVEAAAVDGFDLALERYALFSTAGATAAPRRGWLPVCMEEAGKHSLHCPRRRRSTRRLERLGRGGR